MTDYFISFQSERTGLLPDEPGLPKSYIDANTDFAVSLAKLAELTGEKKYYIIGEQIIRGILNFHRGTYGYYRDVDMFTGEILNPLVETRFVSLLLKALILYRDHQSIYSPEGNWSVFRDR